MTDHSHLRPRNVPSKAGSPETLWHHFFRRVRQLAAELDAAQAKARTERDAP